MGDTDCQSITGGRAEYLREVITSNSKSVIALSSQRDPHAVAWGIQDRVANAAPLSPTEDPTYETYHHIHRRQTLGTTYLGALT